MSIRYLSTNAFRSEPVAPVSLATALLTGLAPDGGLYVPDRVPTLAREDLVALRGRPYREVARAVLRPFTSDLLTEEQLADLCAEAYDFEVPIERVSGRRHVLRLDRGPTASFKDFAARVMGRLLGRLARSPSGAPLVILTATSGDTGSAVAQAFSGVDGIRVVVLFPVDEVSRRQRKQMTTLGGNITTVAVDGKFDDCQALVKRAFGDPDLAGMRLSSANSINVGRLLPQAVYYLHAWLGIADVEAGEPMVVGVPCGNFGNLVGGLLAARMGIGIRRFVIATNANDEVPEFLRTHRYRPIEPSRVCISNAMNVGHPSNLARLVHLYGGHMDARGELAGDPDHGALHRDLWATAVGDGDTRRAIGDAWRELGVLLEPHGAVAFEGLSRYLQLHPEDRALPSISLETAHPAKFPDEVRAATGVEPEVPVALAAIDDLPERYDTMDVDYEGFRAWLLRTHGSRFTGWAS